MKLKLGLLHTDLAYRFSLSLSNVSRIYKSWITILSEEPEIFLVWLERNALRRNLPESFGNSKNCVSVSDCFEVFIERPFDLTARAEQNKQNKLGLITNIITPLNI